MSEVSDRVLVHTCGRESEFALDPPATGTIVRRLMRSAGFWVALDVRQRDEVHPFPPEDPRGTHVLCEDGDDCVDRPRVARS